jgi:hypothetical protein
MAHLSVDGQGFVGPHAGVTGYSRGVGVFSKDSRSLINPAEQVGKQTSGGFGWRAWIGSGGIAGATGGEAFGVLPQPVSRIASAPSVSACRIGLVVCTFHRLLQLRVPAVFLRAGGLHGLRDGIGVGRAGYGMALALDGEPVGLNARRQGDDYERGGEDVD